MKSFVVGFALLAVASAGAVSYVKRTDHNDQGPIGSLGGGIGSYEGGIASGEGGDYYHHYPAYKFEYGVKDPHTGDHKSQWEVRDGDHVKGEYTLDESDGTKRIVKYHADGKSGFHAHVERIGHAHHHIRGGQGGISQGGFGQGGFQ